MEKILQGIFLVFALLVFSLPLAAAEPDRTRAPDQIRDQDIYGHTLMTPQERDAHRTKMRSAKSADEREKLRKDHHEQMKVRAKERGVTLPDEPPAGRGPGSGPGGGGRY